MSSSQSICGLLGVHPKRKQLMQGWNHFFIDQQLAASFHQYATTADTLQLRLSEMFTLHRLFYIIQTNLSTAVIPLLDECSTPNPNVIINNNGVLCGVFSHAITDPQQFLAEHVSVQTALHTTGILPV